MDIIELRDSYIASLKADKAQTTIEGYARTINLFLAWAGDKNAKLNTATIMGWRSHLAEEGDGVTTISLYMQHMRYWCEYISAIQEGFVMPDFGILNPDKRRVSVAKKKPYKHVLGPSEVIAILSADRPSKCSTETWPRNKAILTLFLTGSMRNAELCSIRPCDLDWESHQILLENTKGGMPRYAAFPAIAEKAVTEFAEKLKIPVINTMMAKGIIPYDNPYSMWTVGITQEDYQNVILEEADLVIAVGYDLVEFAPRKWNKEANHKIVHVYHQQ